jgi:hypothetical protein
VSTSNDTCCLVSDCSRVLKFVMSVGEAIRWSTSWKSAPTHPAFVPPPSVPKYSAPPRRVDLNCSSVPLPSKLTPFTNSVGPGDRRRKAE